MVLFKDNGLKPGRFPLGLQTLFLTWLCALPPDAKSCVFLTRDRKHISQLAYATRPFTVLLLFLFFHLLEAYAVLGGGGGGGGGELQPPLACIVMWKKKKKWTGGREKKK